jgi:hypothetical protein
MIESCAIMNQHHFQLDKLSRFSARLEDLCFLLQSKGQDEASPEAADEIAATAGEIMLLLADHGDDELVRGTLDDARRLREVARTLRPQREQVVKVGVALANDVALIINAEKRAA